MGRKCGNCGYELRESAKFCPNCGMKVEDISHSSEKLINNIEQNNKVKRRKDKRRWSKFAIGGIALVLFCTGSYAGYKKFTPNLKKEIQHNKSKTVKEEQIELETIPLNTLDIGCIGAYLPKYSSIKEISNEELKEVYTQLFEYYITENHYRDGYFYTQESDKSWGLNDYNDRRLIDDEQFIEKVNTDNGSEQWIFKGSALNQFNQLVGIEFNPENLDKDRITYDGDRFTVTFTEERLDPIDCDVISVLLDDKKNEIIVNLLKKKTGEMAETEDSFEHAIIVPAKNDYGYEVKRIEAGNVEMSQTVTQIKSNADWYSIEAILDEFENYSTDESDKNATIRKLAMCGKDYADNSRYDVVNTLDDKYGLSREMFYDMCELMGIPREESNIEIQEDEIVLNSQQYEINILYEEGRVNRYLLREEYDNDKNEIRIYYLTTYEDGDCNITEYLRQMIVIKPEKNIFGYKIQEISTEEWDDEYLDEIKEIEEKIQRIEYEWQHSAGTGWYQVDLLQQEVDIWVSEMNRIVECIKEKYPEKKEEIEKVQETEWNETLQWIQDGWKEMETATEEEDMERQENIALNEAYQAEMRVYYLVGNVLMDGKLEEMLNQ